MKKTLIAVSLIAILGLTSCGLNFGGSDDDKTSATEKTTEATTEDETEESTEDKEDTTKKSRKDKDTEASTEASSDETTTTKADKTEPTKEDTTKTTSSAEVKPVEGLSESYADLDNRAFAYDGKVFKLGESTYQDLIDAGLPFADKDLANKDNNVNKNYSTARITIDVTQYSHMQFEFTNFTDSNLTEKECVLSSVRWYPLYAPRTSYDDKRNADIEADIAESAKHVQFSFPLTLVKSDLLANAADGEEDNYNNVDYKIDSTKYYGKSGYHFEFVEEGDRLEDVTISYLP